jgi:hypothetical protein
MSPEDAMNQINRIFEEALLLHGDDVKKVVNYVRTRIDGANEQDREGIDRVLERVIAFRAPDRRPMRLN